MNSLPPTEAMAAKAALGWLELGCPEEAKAELAPIARPYQQHPAILEIRWQIAHDLGDWQDALAIAREEIQNSPTEPQGYIHQAYALRRTKGGGLEKARNALLPAVRLFPEHSLVHYNLACYAAQLGQLDEAWELLLRALSLVEDIAALAVQAMHDEDLRPLWPRLRELTRKNTP